ncbi:hypothetical protein CK203_075067 [Vitis vinifera]|uniref:Uncharacterized protein n=1 Tax=Vitis vinifera TaxID=29760 RepID=A0A438F9S9_VITVI|nr:hypothetical protein CK203_075067 [Vitis vinifera]
MTPRDFFYPRVALDFYKSMTTRRVQDPTVIHFTIDGHHGILGARHIAEALHIPYEPEGASTWNAHSRCGAALQHISTLAYGAEEMSYIGGFIPDIRGFLLWPSSFDYDLSSLLEEKVHRKKLKRADAIPLLFPRLLCQILEHLGYPSKPQLERRRICRELFTLEKWNHLTTYVAPPRAPNIPAPPESPQDEQPP